MLILLGKLEDLIFSFTMTELSKRMSWRNESLVSYKIKCNLIEE